MENQQITRKNLIKLYNEFNCEEWKETIKDILKSTYLQTDDMLVDINNRYIKYLITNGSLEQKRYVKSLGINIEIPIDIEDGKKLFFQLMDGCTIKIIQNKYPTFYNKHDQYMFQIDNVNYDVFYFSKDKVMSELGYNIEQIISLFITILKDFFKIHNIIPIPSTFHINEV